MYDPISVETALVSSGGDLLIQLSDGNVINAGRVRGNPGPQGEQGEQGIRGAHGKDGIDGTHGAKWHTGVGAPEISIGENGDMYMDVASALLPIFQKVGGDWIFLANLKTSSGGGVSGGEGAGGGGGNIIVQPSPGEPTTDGDGNPVNEGDLWYDPTTGWLYVYHQGGWVVVAGDPPVLVSAMPPDQDLGEHPIQIGSLWFDSEQLVLYVAAEDTNGNMVWVIATPSDRSAVDDTVNIPFRPPGFATNGTEASNPVTGIVYVYNAAKKQWIDKAPKMGGAYYQEDAPDPNIENLRPGDLWIDSNTHNLNVWTGDTWAQVNPGCNSNPKVHFQPAAPGGTQHIRGDLWIDSDTNKLFTWNGDVWMEVGASCGGPGTEEFVKIAGDTMTGPLILEDENGNIADISLSSQAVHKTYVDDQDAKLQQEIINLEEEINNIQANVEGGRWNFTVNPAAAAGEFRMSNGLFTQFNQTITIHRKDLNATDHYWAQSEIGHYLEILDQTIGSTNNALYLITDITKDTGDEETVFTLELVRGTGAPTNGQPCVIKTFELQGGDPTAYVRKVGDVMTGPLRLQDDNGNPSRIYLEDQAVHKQYVDEQLFGQNRECIEINGGKLCAGEPMPRWYDIPNWSYKQKNAAGVVHGKSNAQWWEGKQRWFYYTKQLNSQSYYTIKIYISKTSLLDGTWDLFVEYSANAKSGSRVKMEFMGVGYKYLYIAQETSASSANPNSFRGALYKIDFDGNVDQFRYRSSLSGFQVVSKSVDCDGNMGAIVKETKYSNSTFTDEYFLALYYEKEDSDLYDNMKYTGGDLRSMGFVPYLPQRVAKGFYVNYSSSTYYPWDKSGTKAVKHFSFDRGYWSGVDVMSRLRPEKTYFMYNTSTGAYSSRDVLDLIVGDGSNGTPYTYILFNKVLKRFFCVQQYSGTGRFTLDGSMGFKVFRSKEYEHDAINWGTFDWKNLFTFSNGAEEVLDSPESYCRELRYIGGEIITITSSGILASSGTFGEPIIKFPYGKMYGSIDKGDTWDSRESEMRNEDGTLIPNYNAYLPRPDTDTEPLPDGGDYINLNFSKYFDTDDEFYNEEGKITNVVEHDDELTIGYQRYDLPFNLYTGQQELLWNGVQIQQPLPDEDGDSGVSGTITVVPLVVSNYTVTSESYEPYVTDGNVYTCRNNDLTSSSWNQAFLTAGFIKNRSIIPENAVDVEVLSCAGTWTNASSSSYDRVSNVGVAATFNNVPGILVTFINSSTISSSSSYRKFEINLPNAVRYVEPVGSGILPLN